PKSINVYTFLEINEARQPQSLWLVLENGNYDFQERFYDKCEQLSRTIGDIIFKIYEISILGVVLSTVVGTRVHINSSLHVNHVTNMGIDVSYLLDDHVRRARGSTKLSK
ncbi:hypothetical protein, partial [Klebsiella pneumoniae]|uniref:hypothetical protein n=1 Tax=Klebsiella pneumoniae TaxID=573 RepID=UPI003A80B9F3